MRTTTVFAVAAAVVILGLVIWAIDVDQTQEPLLPGAEIEQSSFPEYETETESVTVTRDGETEVVREIQVVPPGDEDVAASD